MLPYLGIVKAGEVWKTEGRKGDLTLRMLADVDLREDDFFNAEIVEGRAQFLSDNYRMAQRHEGYGVAGSVISFRTTLTSFMEKIGDMPIADDEATAPDRDPRLP